MPGFNNDVSAVNMAKEMVRQMNALYKTKFRCPDEFDVPLHRLVRERYDS